MSFLEERLSKMEKYSFTPDPLAPGFPIRFDHPINQGIFGVMGGYGRRYAINELTKLIEEFHGTTSVPTNGALVHRLSVLDEDREPQPGEAISSQHRVQQED
jgi:uncharacterized protein with von Willebrand factor type A (vWA) domain